MRSKQGQAEKPYRRRDDAELRFHSILAAVRAIKNMPDAVRESHRKCLLNCCLWQLTQSDAYGKHNLRYATKTALGFFKAGDKKDLQHEHVHTRKKMIDELIGADSREVEQILRRACGCLVTRDEHELLSVDPEVDGWERYQRAGIQVYDRDEERFVDFEDRIETHR